jgi:hypothetical protein
MLAELNRRATEAGDGATAEDVVCALVAAGEPMTEIARQLSKTAEINLSVNVLSGWMASDPKRKAALAQARKDSAPILVEQAMELIDGADEDRDAIAKAKAQADMRQWMASKYDRATFGNDAAQVNLQFNMGQLHLDALRSRAAIVASTAPTLPPAGPDFETVSE